MTAQTRLQRAADFQLEHFDDGVLLYDARSTRVLHLSATAVLIWQLCDGTRTADEIASLLAEAFPDEQDVAQDVVRTLSQYRDTGAVTLV